MNIQPQHLTSRALSRTLPAGVLVALAQAATSPQVSFAPVTPVATNAVPTPSSSLAADLNGDGITDVLLAGRLLNGDLRLYFLRGEGNRSFAPIEPLAGAGSVFRLPLAADIDGDGDLDLATVDGAGVFVAFENDGAGVFTPSSAAPNGFPRVTALADADADGDLDAFIQSATGEIMLGTFDPVSWSFAFSPSGVTAELETARDLNADGRAELITSDAGLAVFPALAVGYGAPILVTSATVAANNRIDLVVEDLNGDGHLDLAPTGRDLSSNDVFVGDGSLGFAATPVLPPGLPDPPLGFHRYIHADSDGVLDLLYGANINGAPSTFGTFTSIGSGSLPFPGGTPPVTQPADGFNVGAAQNGQEFFQDVDGDGATDFLRGIAVHYGPYAGPSFGFEDQELIADFSDLTGELTQVHAFDVDGDHRPDLVSLDRGRARLMWNRNEGGFRFGPEQELPTGTEDVFSFAAGELLADGPRVLAVASVTATGTEFRIWTEADGVTIGPTPSLGDFGLGVLGFADLNGDGVSDIVTNLGYYSMGGTNTAPAFVRIMDLETTSFAAALAFEDIDSDGDLDILRSGNDTLLRLEFIRNVNSGQSFEPAVTLVPNAGAVAIADFDGDGRLDVARALRNAASPNEFDLTYLRGQGALSFSAPIALASGLPELRAGTQSLQAIDIDGDGDLDLAAAPLTSSSLAAAAVWINNIGTTNPAQIVPVFADSEVRGRVRYVDLDGDGDLDAFAVTLGGSVIAAENLLIPRTGSSFCQQPNPNSTGETGRLDAYGVPAAGGAPLRIVASRLPLNRFGFFLGSPNQAAPTPLANSAGFLCLGAGAGRYSQFSEIGATGSRGWFELSIAPDDLRTGAGAISATSGLSWSFQAWHRDAPSGAGASNLTDGVTVTYQ